jgi:hypothetical protein
MFGWIPPGRRIMVKKSGPMIIEWIIPLPAQTSSRFNLPASKSEGMDFNFCSQLLNFVQVVSGTKG